MLAHAKVMIHDPLIPSTGGSALALKSIADNLMATREIISGILALHTGRSVEEIYEKTKADTYFTAQESVAFGLADKIIRTPSDYNAGQIVKKR